MTISGFTTSQHNLLGVLGINMPPALIINFKFDTIMTISDAKIELGLVSIDLTYSDDKQWLRMWDNNTRTAIVMHTDVDAAILQNKDRSDLFLKRSVVTAKESGNDYNFVIICKSASIDRSY